MAKVTQSAERTLTLGVNVVTADDLPETAYNVSEFINILTEQVGEFDVDLQVGVNQPAGNVKQTEAIGFVPHDFSEEDEYEDGDDDSEDDFDIDVDHEKEGE
jgi:hypothetical protein